MLCFGFALPGVADRYGGMTQDLLWRPGALSAGLSWIVDMAFVVLLGGIFLWLVKAWLDRDRRRLVTLGVVFAALAGFWWFGLDYLGPGSFDAPVLPGRGRLQG